MKNKYFYTDIKVVIIVALISFIGCGASINHFLITDSLVKLEKAEKETGVLKSDLNSKIKSINDLPIYVKKNLLMTKLESSINSQFPETDEIPKMIMKINEIAEQNDVKVGSVTPSTTETLLNESGIPTNQQVLIKSFNVTANSDYLSFLTFMNDISKYARVMQITNIKMSRTDNSTIGISMNINIFYVRNGV